MAIRLALNDRQRERIAPHIFGDKGTRRSSGRDNTLFVQAAPWLLRTGGPWRDLAEEFCPWNRVFRRFSRWCRNGAGCGPSRR